MTSCRLWHWQAINERGELITGSWLLTDDRPIMKLMAERQYLPLACKRGKYYRARDWAPRQKIALMQQLATLLKAGLTLSAGLCLLSEGEKHAGWRALLQALQEEVAQGSSFSSALAQWPMIFPPLYAALMQVGELTGQLDSCCLQLAHQQERQLRLQKKVMTALRYPLFILLVALAVAVAMLLLVLPEFVAIYQTFNAPLPAFTAAVLAFSAGLQQRFLPLLGIAIVAIACWRYQRRRRPGWQRNEQRCLLRLPLLSQLWRGSLLSQIFTTLTLTQQAGLPLLHGLQAVEQTLTPLLWREAMQQLQQRVAQGMPLHLAIADSTLFTPLCRQLIKVGEEAGALDHLLARLAQWHENQTHELADSLAATLEPVMMVITGAIVGTLVIAMYLPIFNLGAVLN
ncbi:protein transport protein HofC [Mixta tenebrionis]|uniref:Protein transport protein HofC n=1 Tax=Mixta tenebrionis TaxID=2562439 RepID=A0A506VEM2_9GAMM|nr:MULTISPECIES: protein transport protein HofC [Mixta]QHM76694.1 Putative type II secretion system protein F [Mixta theicola]TPW43886.1 protein transport protein HofC [Mixta tenebrionis]